MTEKVSIDALNAHLDVDGWSAMKSLTASEVNSVVRELLAYRTAANPLQSVLGKFPSGHPCGCCEIGSYEGQVELVPPPALRRADGRGICVDVCLALEVTQLWKAGIVTTGCCCGHGKLTGYIGVVPEHIERMKALGYEVRPNETRPGDEDGFYPKTRLPPLESTPAPVGEITEEMVGGKALLAAINKLPRCVMETHSNNGDVFVSFTKVRAALTAAMEGK